MKVHVPLWVILLISIGAFCTSLVLFILRSESVPAETDLLLTYVSDPNAWATLKQLSPGPLIPDSSSWKALTYFLQMNRTDVSTQEYAMVFLSFYWSLPVSDPDPCQWDGVTCSTNRSIIGIEASPEWKVFGQLPDELEYLTDLQFLRFPSQSLWYGLDPIYRLTNLRELDLDSNRITYITSSIGALTNLRSLSLQGNQMKGTLPTELARLTNLKHLLLSNNQLEGNLYEYLKVFPNLETLRLSSTLIGGTLPTEIGLLTKLQDFEANLTPLGGRLPSELGLCTSLVRLSLAENILSTGLSGDLNWIRTLTNLNVLSLGPGSTGTIPTEIGLLQDLTYIDLKENRLHGTIPTEIGRLTKLEYFNLQDNPSLSGTIPTETKVIKSLNQVSLTNVNLTGTMPLCETGNRYRELKADCDCLFCNVPPVTCPCCTFCSRT